MSFLPAVRREIQSRQPNNPVRVTLEYPLQRAVGRHNAVPLPTIVADLRVQGLNLTETGFNKHFWLNRAMCDYFIGSGQRGTSLRNAARRRGNEGFLRRANPGRRAESGQLEEAGPRGRMEYLTGRCKSMGLYKICEHKGRLRDRCEHAWWSAVPERTPEPREVVQPGNPQQDRG